MKCLDIIKNALLTVTDQVNHYYAVKKPDKFIVWAEDGQRGSVWADDVCEEQMIEGTVDYFTRQNKDKNVKKIQRALSDAGVVWRLSSVQYEHDTKYIHYEWVWEVCGDGAA